MEDERRGAKLGSNKCSPDSEDVRPSRNHWKISFATDGTTDPAWGHLRSRALAAGYQLALGRHRRWADSSYNRWRRKLDRREAKTTQARAKRLDHRRQPLR